MLAAQIILQGSWISGDSIPCLLLVKIRLLARILTFIQLIHTCPDTCHQLLQILHRQRRRKSRPAFLLSSFSTFFTSSKGGNKNLRHPLVINLRQQDSPGQSERLRCQSYCGGRQTACYDIAQAACFVHRKGADNDFDTSGYLVMPLKS
jgi:hypothetical protein